MGWILVFVALVAVLDFRGLTGFSVLIFEFFEPSPDLALGLIFATELVEVFGLLTALGSFRASRGIILLDLAELALGLVEVFWARLSTGWTDLLAATFGDFAPPLAEVTTFFLRSITLF